MCEFSFLVPDFSEIEVIIMVDNNNNNNNDANTIASDNNNDNNVIREATSGPLREDGNIKEQYHFQQSKQHTAIDIEEKSTVTTSSKNDNDNSNDQVAVYTTDEKNPLTTKQRVIKSLRFCVLMFGLLMGMFMVCLNTTVVAPAMNIIATELNDIRNQTWIATAYLVAMNSFQALAGKFSDVFGR